MEINKNIDSDFISDSNEFDFFKNIEKTYLSNIHLIYYIDYFTYKKELMANISNDIELIINFFNEETNDIILKFLILQKKKNDDKCKIFDPLFELVNLIYYLDFFDQDEFFNILLILFKIKILTKEIYFFFHYFELTDIINIKNFINNFNELYQQISKNNIILKTMLIIISSLNKNIITNEIKNLAQKISFDFFMYHSSITIYDKIFDTLKKINKIKNIYEIYNKKNTHKFEDYLLLIKNNKKNFIDEYNIYSNKYFEIYSLQEFELTIKLKLKKKQNIIKLFNNLKFVNDIE